MITENPTLSFTPPKPGKHRVRPSPTVAPPRRTSSARIAVSAIVPDPDQPRKEFDQDELERLAATLRSHTQLQPVHVRRSPTPGEYILIEGERRWRAAQIADIKALDCIIEEEELTAEEILELQLIVNCQRADLQPMERARAIKRLMDKTGGSGAQIADRVGLDRTRVTRALQLLELPKPIQEHIMAGTIVPAVGVELTKVEDPAEQLEVAEQIAQQEMNREDAAEAVRGCSSRRTNGTAPSKKLTFSLDGCQVTLKFEEVPTLEAILAVLRKLLAQQEGGSES
jgi:ParB family transcriptional regulator, chromosome partitioning protein